MEIVCIAIQVWLFILFIRVILSLVLAFGQGRLPEGLRPVYKVLIDLTEPVLAPVRRAIPPAGMLDLSVFVVFLIGQFALAAIC